MRDLNFDNSGCQPARGPRAAKVLVRRALRWALRPMSARLIEILHSVVDRLDAAEARGGESSARLDAAERRIDAGNRRLDAAERNVEILQKTTEGLGAHLNGLSAEHRELHAQVQPRVVQLNALAASVAGLCGDVESLDEKIQAVHDLHWDHVALARRLARIEDLLVVPTADAPSGEAGGEGARPLLPFPGLGDGARTRAV